jgi:hypothetical protein
VRSIPDDWRRLFQVLLTPTLPAAAGQSARLIELDDPQTKTSNPGVAIAAVVRAGATRTNSDHQPDHVAVILPNPAAPNSVEGSMITPTRRPTSEDHEHTSTRI